jgi:hypothetical protein
MTTYTVLTTFPGQRSSANVGDHLFPGCGISETPLHPLAYRQTEDLDRITVPLIPIGANWNTYTGDFESRRSTRLSAPTLAFLQRVAGNVPQVSCREHHVRDILRRHGIHNTVMTGDPAWSAPEFFGRPFHRPRDVRSVVFSPPLSACYREQGAAVLRMLRDLFPAARRYCAMHLKDLNARRIRIASPRTLRRCGRTWRRRMHSSGRRR